MPRSAIDHIAELEGAILAKDGQLSSLRSQLAEKEKQLDGANESNTAISREIGGLKATIESLTAERDGINTNLEEARRLLHEKIAKLVEAEGRITALEARDPAEQARLEREHVAAARREKEAEQAEEKRIATREKRGVTRQVALEQMWVSLIVLGLLAAVFGVLFLWWDVEFDLWTYIGTLVIIPAVVGLLPQFANHLERMKTWMEQGRHGLIVCAIIGGVIGLLVAIFGIGGEGWAVWPLRVMVFLGYGGYFFVTALLVWGVSGTRKWWGLQPLAFFLMVVAFLGGLIYHPISFELMEEVTVKNKRISTPIEHLVNVGLWLAGSVIVSGLAALIAAPGLELFRKRLGRLPQRRRPNDRWMLVARVIIFAAACIVSWLMVKSLWPADGEVGRKVLSVAIGLITFVGFSFLKTRLFWAADEGRPYGWVLGMSLFMVICTSMITGSVFYEANSADDRMLALKSDIGALQQQYYSAAKPVAERYMATTTSLEIKKSLHAALDTMEKSKDETQAAKSDNELREANKSFADAGSLLKDKLDKGDKGLLEKVVVPTKPSTMTLYLSSLGKLVGISELPAGVKEVYPGALVVSVLMLFVAEFMVLVLFFVMLKSKGNIAEPQHDGWVISCLNRKEAAVVAVATQPPTTTAPDPVTPPPSVAEVEDEDTDTIFIVTCASGTLVSDNLNVMGDDGNAIAVLKVANPAGDAAFICERPRTKGMKPIRNGAFVRIV